MKRKFKTLFFVDFKGNYVMVDEKGYAYYRNATGKEGKCYWKCIFHSKKAAQCYGRAVTFGNKITKFGNIHNHAPPQSQDYE